MKMPDWLRQRLFLFIIGGFFSSFGLLVYAISKGWLDWMVPYLLWGFFGLIVVLSVAGLLRPILALIPPIRRSKWFEYWPEFASGSSRDRSSSDSGSGSSGGGHRFGGGSSGGGGASGGW